MPNYREMDEYGDTRTYGAYDYYQRAYPSDAAYQPLMSQTSPRQKTKTAKPASVYQRATNWASGKLRQYTRGSVPVTRRTTAAGEVYTNPYANRPGGQRYAEEIDTIMGGRR